MKMKPKYIFPSIIILLYLITGYDFVLGKLSENWLMTEGKILSIDTNYREGYYIQQGRHGNSNPIQYSASKVSMKYEYSIDNIKYTSSRLSYPDKIPLDIYKTNSVIKVYYCKYFNNFSVITKGYQYNESNFFWFLILGYITLFYLIFLIIQYRNKLKELKIKNKKNSG